MATLEEIVIQLTAETSQLRAEMAGASKAVKENTEKMNKAIDEFSKNGSKGASFFQTAMATMTGFLGSAAVTGAFNAVVGLGRELADMLIAGGEEAIKEQESLALLANSLATTGNYSEKAMKQLEGLSEEMEGLALVGQDVIQSNIQILSSMTKLNSEGLEKATRLAVDFSAAYGRDLGTATEMIGKAVNGNEAAFKKLGIQVELTGSRSENLRRIQEALAHTQGAAAARANTFGGALFGLKDAYGDLFKELAKTVTQNHVVIAIMDELGKILQSVKIYFQENADTIREKLGGALVSLVGFIQDTVIAFKVMFQFVRAGFDLLMIPLRNMIDGVQLLKSALTLDWEGVKENALDIGENYKKAFESFQAIGSDSATFDPIIDGLGRIKSSAASALDEFGGTAAALDKDLKNTGESTDRIQGKLSAYQEQLKSWVEELAKTNAAFGEQVGGQAEQDALKEQLETQLISQQEYYAQLQELKDMQFLIDQEMVAASLASTEEKHAALLALEQKYANDSRKIEFEKNKAKEQNFKDSIATIATLQSSGNQELAAIGKAAAIYQATIDGYAAVQKALASAPPPFNFAIAAAVGAATASNVAKIAGVQGFARGVDSVPFSASGGNNGDNFPAMLKAGERVVPTETNRDLTEFLANQKQGQNISITVNVAPGTGMSSEQIGNLVEELNNYFTAGGLKLVGGAI